MKYVLPSRFECVFAGASPQSAELIPAGFTLIREVNSVSAA